MEESLPKTLFVDVVKIELSGDIALITFGFQHRPGTEPQFVSRVAMQCSSLHGFLEHGKLALLSHAQNIKERKEKDENRLEM